MRAGTTVLARSLRGAFAMPVQSETLRSDRLVERVAGAAEEAAEVRAERCQVLHVRQGTELVEGLIGPDRVGPLARLLDDNVSVDEGVGVVAGTALEAVHEAEPADEDVASDAAGQGVVARPADQKAISRHGVVAPAVGV